MKKIFNFVDIKFITQNFIILSMISGYYNYSNYYFIYKLQ